MTALTPGVPDFPELPKAPEAPSSHGWPGIALAFGFAILYSYDIWAAVANLLQSQAAYAQIGAPAPWWLYVAGVVLPILIFALAFLIARRRKILEQAVIYFVGLAVVAALFATLWALDYAMFVGELTKS